MSSEPRGGLVLLYDVILAGAAGNSIGWFTWWATGGVSLRPKPFWAEAVAAGVGLFAAVRWVRSRHRARRWVRLLWIPVALFVALMVMLVVALRTWS